MYLINRAAKKILPDNLKNNNFDEILNSNIFWFGLFIKIIFAITLSSSFTTELFIPFINYFIESGFQNPYEYFFGINKSNAFPYPSAMLYILSLPMAILSPFVDLSNISFLTLFLIKTPIFFADFLILVVLVKLIKKNTKKILILYWLSPVLIYINYIHGQLDVIPIAILFISLYFTFKKKFYFSSIFLALAIACKTSILLVLPFYLVYLIYSKNISTKKFIINISLIFLCFLVINIFYITNIDFLQMVFNNKEQLKLFDFNYNFSSGNILYILPIAYILLFLTALNFKGFSLSKDVYMMFLGFSFGIIALLVPPMQGWYYWIIPFFIYFHIKNENGRFDLSLILFFGLQIAYFIYFLVIENSDFIKVFHMISPEFSYSLNTYQFLELKGLNPQVFVNLSFTLLQAMLLVNCVSIYLSGIKSYANYKMFSTPFVLGICGDSAAGKTTISKVLEKIFTKDNTTLIQGDDMHKWERENENWSKFTHLNPKSNFLHNEISQIKAIKSNKVINRKNYDHDTGRFTEAKKFKPSNLIIYEGLHSFYIKQVRDLFDLKIFINPSNELRNYWKIKRDTESRGYSANKISKQIKDREQDSNKFIKSQIQHADIIIEFFLNKKINENDCDQNTLLKISIENSFYLDPLYTEFTLYDSLKVTHEYNDDDRQTFELHGNLTSEDVDSIARNLALNQELENLGIYEPNWHKDYLGIIQIFIVYCIIKHLESGKIK